MSRRNLYNALAIPAAGTTVTDPLTGYGHASYLLMQANFDYGSAGTTIKAFVQTSVDGGVTWIDIAQWAFATTDARKLHKVSLATALTPATVPTDGILADNTVLDGVIGDRIRGKLIVAGTYAASTLTLSVEAK